MRASPFGFTDFSRGLNILDSPYTLREGEARALLNVVATPRGAIRKRFGSLGLAGGAVMKDLPVTDNFNRTENPLSNGGKWTVITGEPDTGKTAALEYWEGKVGEGTSSGAYYNVAETTNPAVSLEAISFPRTLNTFIEFRIWACVQAGARSGYFVSFYESGEPASSVWEIRLTKMVAGISTVLAKTSGTGEITVGTSSAITVRNGIITAWRKKAGTWETIIQAADSTYTKGYGGMSASATNAPKGHYDNFSVGESTASVLPSEEVQSLFRVEPGGVPYLIAAVGKKLFSINGANEVTVIREGLTESAANKWTCVQSVTGTRVALGPVYLSNGTDPPQSWTGAAKGTLTAEWTSKPEGEFVAVPKSKYMVYANGRVWAAGMPGAENCAVRFSGYAAAGAEGSKPDPTNWPKENIVYFDTADSTPITGLGIFGPYVLVFKRRQTYVIYDLNEGENRKISDSVGCAAHRSIVETSIGTFFLTPDQGVYITNGSSVREVSRNVRPALQGVDSETNRNLQGSEIEKSAGGFLNGHYYLSYRTSAGTIKTFDYDTVAQGWWLHDLGGNQWAVWEPTVNVQALYTCPKGTTAGIVRAWINGIYTDSGVNYTGAKEMTCYWSSAWEPFFQYVLRHRINQPQVRKRIRTLFVDGKGQLITKVSRKFEGSLEELRGVVDSNDEALLESPLTLGNESKEYQAARYYSLGESRIWSFTFGNNSSEGLEVDAYACDLSFKKS